MFLAVVVGLASLTLPEVFQVVCRWAIQAAAWRHGTSVTIERVEGSLWEPVVLGHSLWISRGVSGAVMRMEISRAEARLSWLDLFRRNGDRWFQHLSISGVQGKIEIPIHTSAPESSAASPIPTSIPLPRASWVPLPDSVDAREVDIVFQSDADYVRIEKANFSASSLESGELRVDRLTIRQPWLNRSFRGVRGKTAILNNRIALANVVLEPGVEIRTLSASPNGLAHGHLDVDGEVAAFDGTLKFHAATKEVGGGLLFEAGSTFGQINIAKLASFLALSDASGGIIKDGKFSYLGPPRNPAKAQGSLRLDAVNFQWESRQWDSLALGILLMDRRLQVPQLNLRQGKNELRLSGELALPDETRKWWQGDFTANVDAKIENLTELSALLLPEFKYAAGKATIEGSVRGHGEEFNGQLLVSGSDITWRNAPIQTLHGAIKLNGKEIQIANVELINKDDFLRGRGLVKLASPPVYWGELRVSVEDLASYAAFLGKPVLPEPLAGGAIVDWTGEGSQSGHSGSFFARLKKVRTLGALAQQLHPMNAELEANYSPGSMQFSRFVLSDDESMVTANLAVGAKVLNLQNLRFLHNGVLQLEGSALLPLDVWQQWPNVSLQSLLTEDVVSRVQLTAKKLDLAKASLLTGWKFPIAGVVDGTFTADGSIKALKLGGNAELSQGRIPLGWTGNLLTDASGKFAFQDDLVTIESFAAKHAFGEVQIGGTAKITNMLDPQLDLTLKSPRFTAPLFKAATAANELDLSIKGPLSAATVGGNVALRAVSLGRAIRLNGLWDEGPIALPHAFSFPSPPWSNWTADLNCHTDGVIHLTENPGTVSVDVKVGGSGIRPTIAGRVEFSDVGVRLGGWKFMDDVAAVKPKADGSMEWAVANFVPDRTENPSIEASFLVTLSDAAYWQSMGSAGPISFRAEVTGPLSRLMRTYDGPPPLTNEAVRGFLAGQGLPDNGEFSLEVNPPVAAENGLPFSTELRE